MLTTSQAADAFGVSELYLSRLVRAGRLPGQVTGDRQLIPQAAVRAFKEERDRTLQALTKLAAAEEQLGVR